MSATPPTSSPELPLPPGMALVVSGAANWQLHDRYLPPESIEPLQVVTAEAVEPCPWFARYRQVGVSSLIALPGDRSVLFTTGGDLVCLGLDDGGLVEADVDGLEDVHELILDGASVLIANTGRDEALIFDLGAQRVTRRIDLGPLRAHARPGRPTAAGGVASFHLNQVLADGGRLLGLVHHAEGFRLFSHAQRRLTGHGSGGVLDLESGWRRDLRLHAPHTVRRRPGGWLVLNSGRKEMLLLDDDWRPEGVVRTRGWGRGGALSPDGRLAYVGISGIRRRYARPGDSRWTGVEVIDLETDERWALQLPAVEQVNAVELCAVEVAARLAALPDGAPGRPSEPGRPSVVSAQVERGARVPSVSRRRESTPDR